MSRFIPARMEGNGRPGTHLKIRCDEQLPNLKKCGMLLAEARIAADGDAYLYVAKWAPTQIEATQENYNRRKRNLELPEVTRDADSLVDWNDPNREWLDNLGPLAESIGYPQPLTGPEANASASLVQRCRGRQGFDGLVEVSCSAVVALLESSKSVDLSAVIVGSR